MVYIKIYMHVSACVCVCILFLVLSSLLRFKFKYDLVSFRRALLLSQATSCVQLMEGLPALALSLSNSTVLTQRNDNTLEYP